MALPTTPDWRKASLMRIAQQQEENRRRAEQMRLYMEMLQNEQNSRGGGSSNTPSMSTYDKIMEQFGMGGNGGVPGGGGGTSGSMGMGSDSASLQFAESQMGGGGGQGAGMGLGSYLGIIAAAIAAQHMFTGANNRVYEGVETGDAFSGQFGTEPWFAWLNKQWGGDATAGEKFDAAIKNGDYRLAMQRLPLMGDYWADPARGMVDMGLEKVVGEDAVKFLDPIQGILKSIFGG